MIRPASHRFPCFAALLILGAGVRCGVAQKLTPVTHLAPLPAGLTLPVRLSHGLKAGGSKPGAPVILLTTQRVPVSATQFLPPETEVLGTVTSSSAGDRGSAQAATLTVHVESLRLHNQTVPLRVQALAIANFSAAEDTYDPVSGGGDRENNTPANWTTLQVGGDVLTRFNWDGVLDSKTSQKVGYADFYGVYATPVPGATGAAAIPHAVGIFSTTAHGLYGFDTQAVLRSSHGSLTVTAPGNLVLRTGDQMLLEVIIAP